MDSQSNFSLPFFSHITFDDPWLLVLLLLIPALIVWYIASGKRKKPEMKISSLLPFKKQNKSAVVRLLHVPFILRCLTLAVVIVALARPQSSLSMQEMTAEGIDIMLTMDLSSSMLAQDLKPNRLEAAKNVAIDFIDGRPSDRIGLVVFSGEAFSQCPLTIDHSILKTLISVSEPGFLPDGTAIGLGLASAVNRLKESKATSKVVILITDGENNAGGISPLMAADIAQLYGIRVYTIGAGTRGMAYSPAYPFPNGGYGFDYIEVKIDEPLLKQISSMTGGQYFRATNNEALKDIYKKIDELEKTRFDASEFRRKKEEFWPWLLVAVCLLCLEWLLRNTLMRSIP